jgi:hypothetical protein
MLHVLFTLALQWGQREVVIPQLPWVGEAGSGPLGSAWACDADRPARVLLIC